MRILFYSIQGLSPFHFGTELEIMTHLQEEGHEVHVLACNQALDSCFFNPCHNLLGCAICQGRTDTFLKKIGIPAARIHYLTPSSAEEPQSGLSFRDLDELLRLEVDGLEIGRGVASSAISTFRDYQLTDQAGKSEYLAVQWRMARQVLRDFSRLAEQLQPDRVYLFNGRFAEYFPLVEYCRKHGIDYVTHERGSTYQSYALYPNSLPHSITVRQQRIAERWAAAEPEARERTGRAWFTRRRKGVLPDAKNFARELTAGTMPEGFDPARINVAIFNSSEDEMKAIGEWQTPLYRHQNEAIRNILEGFRDCPGVHFYLRMHPNLRGVDNVQTRELYELDYPYLTLIRPEERIDTYALLEGCDKTISFGSTVGIEATFWGRPSILFGKAFYDQLDAVYRPQSVQELAGLVLDPGLPPKPQVRTLPYGYFLSTFGRPFRYFHYRDKHRAQFMGKPMRRIHAATFWRFLQYLPRLGWWNRMNRLIFGRSMTWRDIFKLKSHTVEKIG